MKRNPRIALLGMLLLVSAPLSSQGDRSADLRAHGNFGVFAVSGKTTVHKNLAHGAKVPSQLEQVLSIPSAGGHTSSVTWWRRADGSFGMNWGESGAWSVRSGNPSLHGGSTSSAPSSTVIKRGPRSLLLTLRGKAGTKGLFKFYASGSPLKGVSVKFSIDVGNDNKSVFVAAMPAYSDKVVPVTFGKSGMVVVKFTSDVTFGVKAGVNSLYKTLLSVYYSMAPICHVGGFGVDHSCGPRLIGWAGSDAKGASVQMAVSKMAPKSKGVLVIGAKSVRLHDPYLKCPLLVDPVVLLPFVSDGTGTKAWLFRFKLDNVDAKLQCVELGRTQGLPSDALRVVCLK